MGFFIFFQRDKNKKKKERMHAGLLIFLLRITLGWLFFYAGITKVLNPNWSAAGFLNGAVSFKGFYGALAMPEIIPLVNFLNEWGLTLLGVSLILGIGVRLSSVLGALLMGLYYLPSLHFPYVGDHSLLVDEHVIYAIALLYLATVRAGRHWGLEEKVAELPAAKKIPQIGDWFG